MLLRAAAGVTHEGGCSKVRPRGVHFAASVLNLPHWTHVLLAMLRPSSHNRLDCHPMCALPQASTITVRNPEVYVQRPPKTELVIGFTSQVQ